MSRDNRASASTWTLTAVFGPLVQGYHLAAIRISNPRIRNESDCLGFPSEGGGSDTYVHFQDFRKTPEYALRPSLCMSLDSQNE
jgi:hypothetical protein